MVVGVDGEPRTATRVSVAITSLTFMLVLVPEPVWKTSTGNWSTRWPASTSLASRASPASTIASEMSDVITPVGGVDGGGLDLDRDDCPNQVVRERPGDRADVLDRVRVIAPSRPSRADRVTWPHPRYGPRLIGRIDVDGPVARRARGSTPGSPRSNGRRGPGSCRLVGRSAPGSAPGNTAR